jgi:methylenetetrahydrofolate reductase (NADPH)
MLASVLDEADSLGIENILALRGDPPRGETEFKPVPGGFAYAVDLVRFVKGRNSFAVGAACYPEGHIECRDKYLDWDRAAAKVEAGAEFLITQLFYDANDFLAFEDYMRHKHGVRVPIIPGVLPFLSTEQIKRFTRLCGAKLSDGLIRQLETYAADDESVRRLGVDVCTDICRRLLDHGVPGIHLYSLNRSQSCTEILGNLGLAR